MVPHRLPRVRHAFIALTWGAILWLQVEPLSGAITKTEKTLVTGLQRRIDVVANVYKQGDYAQAATRLKSTIEYFEKIVANADEDLITALEPQYKRLQKAHELLAAQNQALDPLPELSANSTTSESPTNDRRTSRNERADEEDSEDRVSRRERRPSRSTRRGEESDERESAEEGDAAGEGSGSAEVGFTADIAPLLVKQCGTCHLDQAKGEFRINTFAELMAGGESGEAIIPGDASGSMLVQLIRDKKMPPRKGLPAAELRLLERWIQAGAKFDGDDDSTPLPELTPQSASAPVASASVTPPAAAPTQESTAASSSGPIRFSQDIAPLLVANCANCHIREQKGSFNMTTFGDLLNGGESGDAVIPRNPEESLLFTLVRDQKMPPRRGLPPEQVELIRRWIQDGAVYDVGDDGLELTSFAAGDAESDSSAPAGK